jgi:hypothetical protein
MKKYELQNWTFVDGWINTSTEENEKGEIVPLVFNTRAEAQADLDEFMGEIADQIASGEREADHGYSWDDWRIREVAM